ncbi:MAG: flavodoxin domain-containing protein [Clostridia bacterium]|nr:flavodoxin domain-containing protein [Clostridia bacterium]
MKTLIAYASKTGTARRCAEALAGRVEGAALCDLTKEQPDPSGYDAVILGGSVRMGQIHNDLKKYAQGAQDVLKDKRLGLFITCGYDDLADTIIENNLPEALVSAAKVKMSFGGEMDLDKQKGFDRIICKMALKSIEKDGGELPRLYPKRYARFITELMSD